MNKVIAFIFRDFRVARDSMYWYLVGTCGHCGKITARDLIRFRNTTLKNVILYPVRGCKK